MKRNQALPILLIVFFILSRLYIWFARPMAFTEIIYSYMPYANLWASGTKPYLQQWYEYPPATIPLFYIPHVIDMATRFKLVHLNYLDAYRSQLLLWDTGLFFLLWLTLKKIAKSQKMHWIALLYYILLMMKAHDFAYDTMDLTFGASIILGVVAPVLVTGWKGQITSWFGFFLATALKYVNAPLAPLYALIERREFKRTAISAIIGFLLIWAVPLAIFRSSILVSLVYQNIRGIQIDSAPAIVLRTMNAFTHSEHVIEVFKNYEIAGPLTDKAKSIEKYFFPAAVAAYLLASSVYVLKNKSLDANWSRIHFTYGYVLIFFLTGKVLSTPFLLWMIPLVAVYPFRKDKQQLTAIFLSSLAIFATMTRFSDDSIGIFPIPLIAGWVRTLSILGLFIQWCLMAKLEVQATQLRTAPKRSSLKGLKSR